MSGIAQKLAHFVAGLDTDTIPGDVLDKARLALIHNLSVAAASGRLGAVANQWSKNRWGGSGARVLVSGVELAPPDAAFANGCLIHARAQDDVYFPGLTHVGAATTPAVLALGEARRSTLGEVLTAIVAGYEVAAAISGRTAPQTTSFGLRGSGIYGVFASSTAAARLLKLDAEATGHAIAIAASFSAGTNQTWVDGSLEWQFQLGNAARSGLEAASLAAAGGTGAQEAFEGAAGFYASFARDRMAGAQALEGLGEVWRTREVTFKPYPVCAILQSPVEAAIDLHRRVGRVATAQRGTLRLTPAEAAYPGTDGLAPFDDAGAALMSAGYCLAVGLTEGIVTASDLFRSHEAALGELANRIEVIPDASLSQRQFVLEVEYEGGRIERVEHAGGEDYNWDLTGLRGNLVRLQDEVPSGINLERLVELVHAELETPIAAVVDTVVAR
jgi:2-methylcitrate dehydratase PrpD